MIRSSVMFAQKLQKTGTTGEEACVSVDRQKQQE